MAEHLWETAATSLACCQWCGYPKAAHDGVSQCESEQATVYAEGYAAGRAGVLALVRKLPSPITEGYWVSNSTWSNSCQWCGSMWAAVTPTQHPSNGCLFVLAQETGKEQA